MSDNITSMLVNSVSRSSLKKLALVGVFFNNLSFRRLTEFALENLTDLDINHSKAPIKQITSFVENLSNNRTLVSLNLASV